MPENNPLYKEMRVNEYLRFRGGLKGLSRSRGATAWTWSRNNAG